MNILVAQSKSITTIMLIIGVVSLLLAFFVIFLYKRKINKEKNNREAFELKEFQTKYKIFYFWGHVAYILIIFTLFIASIIFITIGVGALLN